MSDTSEQAAKPRAIDKIRSAFLGKMWSYYVKEWDLTVYFTPLTTADVTATNIDVKDVQSLMERNVQLLIRKARNADGSPMFLAGDAHALMNEARFSTLQDVIAYMNTCGSISFDEGKEALTTGERSDPLEPSTPSESPST